MTTALKTYLKLKREAMRQMMSGDMERYMNSLRLLSELRSAQRAAVS